MRVECKYIDNVNKKHYLFYSVIPMDTILNMKEDNEFESKFQNFNLKLSEITNKLRNGILGGVTNAMLYRELENIFSILDKLKIAIDITHNYYVVYKHAKDVFGKQMYNVTMKKLEEIKEKYINIFEIFNQEIYVDLTDTDIKDTLLNFLIKDKIRGE